MLTHICRVKKSWKGWNLQEGQILHESSFSLWCILMMLTFVTFFLYFLSSSFIFEIRRQQSIKTKPNKTQYLFVSQRQTCILEIQAMQICFISGVQAGKGHFIYRENSTCLMYFCLQGEKQQQQKHRKGSFPLLVNSAYSFQSLGPLII